MILGASTANETLPFDGELTSYWYNTAVNFTSVTINGTIITLYLQYDAQYLHVLVQLQYFINQPQETCNLYLNNSVDLQTLQNQFNNQFHFTATGTNTGYSGG